jgi:hypothetical protein
MCMSERCVSSASTLSAEANMRCQFFVLCSLPQQDPPSIAKPKVIAAHSQSKLFSSEKAGTTVSGDFIEGPG